MQLTYPGVYVEEISSGVHAIVGVATSIAAFVGYTQSGPDHKAVELFSFADFQRNFGGLAADSELSYAVQQFFANGGTTAIVVRVPKDGATAAQIIIPDGGDSPLLTFTAASTGAWAGSIALSVDYIGLSGADPDAFNLTITNISTGVAESFPNVSMNNAAANYVLAVVNDPDTGSQLVQAIAIPANPTLPAQPARTGLISGSMTSIQQASALAALQVTGQAAGLTISIDGGSAINVTLYGANDPRPASLAEVYRMLSVKTARALQASYPGAQVSVTPVKSALTATALDSLSIVVSIPSKPDCVATFGSLAGGIDVCSEFLLAAPFSNNVAAYWLGGTTKAAPFIITVTGANDGTAPPTSVELIGDELLGTGIYALDKVDLFNLLCMPDATQATVGAPTTPYFHDNDINAIYAAAMDYCKKRRAFLLLDSPPDVVDVASAINWRTNRLTVHDLNGAVYFPRLRLADPLNQNQLRSFAPSGVVAGVYATEDGNRGVWKAPAGIETVMSGVQKLTYNLSNDEQGVLNPIALNCFRTFPIYGAVLWGARTLVGADAEASEWKYVPVRRFALFLEESLYRGLQWAVFEPNAEPLWAQLRMNVTSFMQTLFLKGAFQGKTPAQAYYVMCDSSTTTQADIDAGVVNIQVGFAPLEPAEFVVIQLRQMAGQVAV
ncbi:phage tail sheath C-terminal domain-containing protein [Dyella silvae]|uniref:phage tail sheath C-terminal domain-containing protein n=1 Tax=Dyella silvae TaxID=2994424 RepID=UPI00226519F0|nr:phage tail sheath C-terminal domain-containing protein [Dyella silvae]